MASNRSSLLQLPKRETRASAPPVSPQRPLIGRPGAASTSTSASPITPTPPIPVQPDLTDVGDLQRMAAKYRKEAIAVLVATTRNERASATSRSNAARALLEYSDGRPAMAKQVTVADIASMTDVEQHALLDALLQNRQLRFPQWWHDAVIRMAEHLVNTDPNIERRRSTAPQHGPLYGNGDVPERTRALRQKLRDPGRVADEPEQHRAPSITNPQIRANSDPEPLQSPPALDPPKERLAIDPEPPLPFGLPGIPANPLLGPDPLLRPNGSPLHGIYPWNRR
jgi:hypothetical protein